MLKLISRISDFNFNVIGIGPRAMTPLVPNEAKWLASALMEEAGELIDSWDLAQQTTYPELTADVLVAQVDACGDAVVFAIGGLVRLGLTEDQILKVLHTIMDANFEKKAGVKEGRTGAPDAIKPEGWVGPEARIKELLNV